MQRTCANSWCGVTFEIAPDDLAFYDKVSPVFNGKKELIPPPMRCPECRQQRRMAFRNERSLHSGKCDRCAKPLMAIHGKETSFPVYCYDCWWSDEWGALLYRKDYDPNRPFFEQFKELLDTVPRLGVVTGHNENCSYCNYVNYSKNSYLCFGCHSAEYCFHCWRVHWSESCIDCLQLDKGKHCFEVIDCDECYNLLRSQDCTGCSDSTFLCDCKGCSNCTGCIGLRNKRYCLFNEELPKEEYERRVASLNLDTASGIEAMRKVFEEFKASKPHRHAFILNSENAHGDHITDSLNCYECYHVKEAEDCRYLESCEKIKNGVDNTFSGWPAELIFETMSAGVNCYNSLFCAACWSCSNVIYSDSCHHSQNLFGCVGLRKKNSYCILNKQYTKEEYEALVPKIIEHMRKTGEWGEFFPVELSHFAYNETVAQEYFPLTKEEVLKRSWKWRDETDEMPKVDKIIPAERLPDSIDDIPDDILNWAIRCEATSRPFRIVKQELSFYRKMRLPVPHFHPDERHRRRMALRNPRKLWKRTCMKCQKPIQTTYSPERPERVYCEECYLKEVY